MNKIQPIYKILLFITLPLIFLGQCDQPHEKRVVEIKLDLTKTGEPIEKYIYGQFIEHLGRCIYGGIWAEMIQDRKFYFPVKKEFDPYGTDSDPSWDTGPYTYLKGSPWQVIGDMTTIIMDNRNAYTGEHNKDM